MRKHRVGFVVGHPTQWQSPFFGYLQSHSDLEVHVLYNSRLGLDAVVEKDSGLAIQFDMPGLVDGYKFRFSGEPGVVEQWLSGMCDDGPLDALVIEGHAEPLQRQIALTARKYPAPVLYRSDSTLLYKTPPLKAVAKRIILPHMFKRFSAFLPLSSPAAQYLKHYGVPAQKIFTSSYMVHNDWYDKESARWRGVKVDTKRDLGLLRFDRIALAILRFEERENPLEFVRAAALLERDHPTWGFALIGDGRLRLAIQEEVTKWQLKNFVLPGYQPISALPKYYAVSDVFVHPAAEECWGLSVNEAVACGVPVVVSSGVGCRFDLIPTPGHGRIYPLGDVVALARAVEDTLLSEENCAMMIGRARENLKKHSYTSAAVTFEKAIAFSLAQER